MLLSLLVIFILLLISGCNGQVNQIDSLDIENSQGTSDKEKLVESEVIEDGTYSTTEEVAEYIHKYKKLPKNFITKKEAMALGWESSKGNLWEVTEKMSIGGDVFGNREGRLPKKDKRKWYECDVNYYGGYRGEERIVYSNDGLIFYSHNHYETFKQLY